MYYKYVHHFNYYVSASFVSVVYQYNVHRYTKCVSQVCHTVIKNHCVHKSFFISHAIQYGNHVEVAVASLRIFIIKDDNKTLMSIISNVIY